MGTISPHSEVTQVFPWFAGTETRVLYVHVKYSLNLVKMHSCSQQQVFYHTHAVSDPAEPNQIKEEWTKPTKLPPRFPYHH